jgi:hypothetical protein
MVRAYYNTSQLAVSCESESTEQEQWLGSSDVGWVYDLGIYPVTPWVFCLGVFLDFFFFFFFFKLSSSFKNVTSSLR